MSDESDNGIYVAFKGGEVERRKLVCCRHRVYPLFNLLCGGALRLTCD